MGYILTLLSAIIYYLSFNSFTNGYSIFISLVPFLFSISKAKSIKTTAFIGAAWGITLSILFSIPLFYALLSEYDFSIFYSTVLITFSVFIPYAIIYGLFGVSFRYFFSQTGIYFPIFAASLWIIIDYIMSVTPVFMPWGFAGYSQVLNPLIQIADISGIYGVTFLIILINALVTVIFLYPIKHKYKRISMLIVFLLISTVMIYGNLRIKNINRTIKSNNNSLLNAAVVQGNFDSKEKWDSRNTSAIINTYISITKQIIENANIIVWPETVLNSSDRNNLEVISGISSLLKEKQIFITGATRKDSTNKFFNSILTADKDGLKYIYDKKILFPFTESKFAGLSSGKFIDAPSIFFKGKTKPVFKSELTTIGFTICFESIYPDYVRKIKNQGATILINVANDSWFGNTYEPYLHVYSNIARAIENRFYIIRSSNSGISAIISPTGEILDSIDLNSRDKILTKIQTTEINSFYSKYGDWIIVLALTNLIIFLIFQLKNQIRI